MRRISHPPVIPYDSRAIINIIIALHMSRSQMFRLHICAEVHNCHHLCFLECRDL